MKIQERIVSVKRHTKGFVISGKKYTRKQAVNLVRKGLVKNATIVDSATYGKHLVGKDQNLYDLPIRVVR